MLFVRLCMGAAALFIGMSASGQTTITVTNATDVNNGDTSSVSALVADDGGDGISYREAVTALNQGASGAGAPYTVAFAGDFTINLQADCAGPTRPFTVVDAGENEVIFDGQGRSFAGPSFFAAANSEVHGITVQHCSTAGILLVFANNSVVQGCTLIDNDAGIGLISLGTISNVQIGGTGPGESNTLTGNDLGVELDSGSTNITISGNALFDNGAGNSADGIVLNGAANGGIAAPVITGISPVSGTGPANATIEVFADDAGQGETYIESTAADGAGNWSLTLDGAASAYEGRNLTATATGTTGNTSPFSAPVTVPATAPSVSAIALDNDEITNAQSVSFSVSFTEAVSGIETSVPSDDFALDTDLSGAAITAVAGSGAEYTVTVDIGTGEGTLRLMVLDTGGIEDAGGLGLAGPVTSVAEYTIDRIEIIADLPANIDATTGDTIVLEVEATGPAPLEYQWYKETNDKALLPVGTDSPALELENVGLDDEADYYVEVMDGNETVQSNTTHLHVTVGVPALYGWGIAILAALVAVYAARVVRGGKRRLHNAG